MEFPRPTISSRRAPDELGVEVSYRVLTAVEPQEIMFCIFNSLNLWPKLCISDEDSVGSKRPQKDDAATESRPHGGRHGKTHTNSNKRRVGRPARSAEFRARRCANFRCRLGDPHSLQ